MEYTPYRDTDCDGQTDQRASTLDKLDAWIVRHGAIASSTTVGVLAWGIYFWALSFGNASALVFMICAAFAAAMAVPLTGCAVGDNPAGYRIMRLTVFALTTNWLAMLVICVTAALLTS